MRQKYLLATLATVFIGSVAHAAPIIQNGDFSSSSYTSNTEFGTAASGGFSAIQGVTGWTGNGGYNIYFTSPTDASSVNTTGEYSYTGLEKLYGPVPVSPTGGAFVGLDGDPAVRSSISQTISGLTVGQSYQISFDWGAAQVQSEYGPTTMAMQPETSPHVIRMRAIQRRAPTFSMAMLLGTSSRT